MISGLLRTGFLLAALSLAGCTESSMDGVSGLRADAPIPAKVLAVMQKKGMSRSAPIMARIFKEEGQVEIWKQKPNGRYDLLATYEICKWSGKLGPKFTEGDRQAPEGFYTVRPAQMNPQSSYHLAFNMGFPNAYDRAHGRTGANLMVHGACSSSGCYSMTDASIEQIYSIGREAFRGGQTEFQIQAFPFRMTAANMARYRSDPNYPFWEMLKEGYDHFEITRVPPKVDVCEKRYVFNRIPEGDAKFLPTGACPPSTQSAELLSAYQSYRSTYDAAFNGAIGSKIEAPKPTIAGLKEAAIVSDWSKKRARGERVSLEPPSLNADGTVSVSARMGRIDSPAGRKMAAAEAAAAEKKRIADEKAAALAEKKAAKAAATEANAAAVPPPVEAPAVAAPENAASAEPAAPPENRGLLGGVRKRLGNIFGS